MFPKNQQSLDIDELLDDIHYVNQSAETEIQRVGDRIRRHVNEVDLPQNVLDLLIEDISTHLGQLTARVKLTEKALLTLKIEHKYKVQPGKPHESQNNSQTRDKSFPASQLAANGNLWPVEFSSTGISYRWSGADPEIQLAFIIDRQKEIELQVRLFALIKPDYLRQLKIYVDGQHKKHRFTLDGRLFVVSCVLPVSNNASQTEIKILLPDTHSPSSLGNGPDDRKLGIAISEVRFGKPMSGFTYFLKRLRLKK